MPAPNARAVLRVLALALLAGGSTSCGAQETVELLDWTTVLPEGWITGTASSAMRLAEFSIGTDSGAAEAVVYYFGAGQGGSVDANVARWTSQFVGEDGRSVTPTLSHPTATRFPTTVVELTGTYARQVGMGSDEVGVPGQRLLSAVVETPRGSLFIQMHGPVAAVAAATSDFNAFVEGIGGAGS